MTKTWKDYPGLYRHAVALLAMHARNGQYPTTEAAALSSNLFVVGFDKLLPDVNRYIERNGLSWLDTNSTEFKEWWRKNMEGE